MNGWTDEQMNRWMGVLNNCGWLSGRYTAKYYSIILGVSGCWRWWWWWWCWIIGWQYISWEDVVAVSVLLLLQLFIFSCFEWRRIIEQISGLCVCVCVGGDGFRWATTDSRIETIGERSWGVKRGNFMKKKATRFYFGHVILFFKEVFKKTKKQFIFNFYRT